MRRVDGVNLTILQVASRINVYDREWIRSR